MTVMPYGMGPDALSIEAQPCPEEHSSFPNRPPETPHMLVVIDTHYYRVGGDKPILNAMFDSEQARAIGQALIKAADELEY